MNKTNDLEKFRNEIEEDIRNFNSQKAKQFKEPSKKTSDSKTKNSYPVHNQERKKQSTQGASHVTQQHKKMHHSYRKKKSKRRLRKVFASLIAVFAIFVGIYGFVNWELSRINRYSKSNSEASIDANIDKSDEYGLGIADSVTIQDPNITNILLIGQDRREGQKAEMRSDAMIIASINNKTKKITQISLMRDMYVPIPGYGYGLLNTTYMIGGFDLLNETIEKNFGIAIDGNVEVDFNRFYQLMTILNGLELNLSKEEANYLNNNSSSSWSKMSGVDETGWNLKEGVNTMTPEQITLYCRMRKNVGGDWGRTDRQRKVVMACFKKLKESGTKTILKFTHEALPLLTTNLTNGKIIKAAYAISSYRMSSQNSYRIPLEGTYTQELREDTLHVLIPDIHANKQAIQEYIYPNN